MKLLVGVLLAINLASCGSDRDTPEQPSAPDPTAGSQADKELVQAAKVPAKGPKPVLLVAQSQFKADDKGTYTVPDAAVLLVLTPSGKNWSAQRIVDRQSNVFHKALPYGDEGILTLGANEAMLKLWKRRQGKWEGQVLWHPTFGGKHNRLRDFEIADFNGDGTADLAVATHDQGVVAVVWRRGETWEAEELDRQQDVFVHEIETGDLDRDGKVEFYATPSAPNTLSGKAQGGKIIRFSWTGNKFDRSEVVSLETRHVKEILVSDVDGDGVEELYAALEAETDGANIVKPVEIRRYDCQDGKFKESTVTEISDRFCRFLVAGDLDHDGTNELVAASFSAGIWVIEQQDGKWQSTCIDSKSGGFEHAVLLADLEGDGQLELYVADDNHGVIRRYSYQEGQYQSTVINRRVVPGQAMVWNITTAEI